MSLRLASAFKLPQKILEFYQKYDEIDTIEWVELVSTTEYKVHFLDGFDHWTFNGDRWIVSVE